MRVRRSHAAKRTALWEIFVTAAFVAKCNDHVRANKCTQQLTLLLTLIVACIDVYGLWLDRHGVCEIFTLG